MTSTNTPNASAPSEPCDYFRGTWQCRGDGQLWDADSDGYDPDDTSEPCPGCNTLQYLQDAKEEAETTVYHAGISGMSTGEDIWLSAVTIAKEANLAETESILATIGPVDALVPDDNCEDQVRVVRLNAPPV